MRLGESVSSRPSSDLLLNEYGWVDIKGEHVLERGQRCRDPIVGHGEETNKRPTADSWIYNNGARILHPEDQHNKGSKHPNNFHCFHYHSTFESYYVFGNSSVCKVLHSLSCIFWQAEFEAIKSKAQNFGSFLTLKVLHMT